MFRFPARRKLPEIGGWMWLVATTVERLGHPLCLPNIAQLQAVQHHVDAVTALAHVRALPHSNCLAPLKVV